MEAARTLSHLSTIPTTFKVYCICAVNCERSVEIDHKALVWDQGDMTIPYFRKKIRCSQCGARTEDIKLVCVGKTGFGYRGH